MQKKSENKSINYKNEQNIQIKQVKKSSAHAESKLHNNHGTAAAPKMAKHNSRRLLQIVLSSPLHVLHLENTAQWKKLPGVCHRIEVAKVSCLLHLLSKIGQPWSRRRQPSSSGWWVLGQSADVRQRVQIPCVRSCSGDGIIEDREKWGSL